LRKPSLLCIVGPSCAGKTTVATIISELTGLKVISASNYPRRRHSTTGLNMPLLEYVEREFTDKGLDTFAKELVLDLERDWIDHGGVGYVIDGFRAVEEVDLLAHKIGSTSTLGVFADSRTRFSRNIIRDKVSAITDYSKFVEKDLIEYGFGIAKLMAYYAKPVLVNEGDLPSLKGGLTPIFRGLGTS